jgi:hypothetical protein
LPVWRHLDTTVQPTKQSQAQPIFQRFNLSAYGTLRQAQLIRRERKAQVTCDSLKAVEQVQRR